MSSTTACTSNRGQASSPFRISVSDSLESWNADAATWSRLLTRSDTVSVFQTPEWQDAWWEAFGRGTLLLVKVYRHGRVATMAPLFADSGMVFFVGSGGSDYLDFLGDTDPEILAGVLTAVRERVPGFLGFRFYHVPDASRTGARLNVAAGRAGLVCYAEDVLPAPVLELDKYPQAGEAAIRKKSLVRHQRYFEREGGIEVLHLRWAEQILPRLDAFFSQHERRWRDTPYPSLFTEEVQKSFYRQLTRRCDGVDWLRFTEVWWRDTPIAFHFGFAFAGSFLWYKPSFDISLARHSPGEVLLRQLLVEAMGEGMSRFDFGLGDEAFKRRFATSLPLVRNWGLYPPSGGA